MSALPEVRYAKSGDVEESLLRARQGQPVASIRPIRRWSVNGGELAPGTSYTRWRMTTQSTHTFLFSDIERSTSLLQRLGGEGYAALLEREAQILSDICAGQGGQLVDREGDGCVFVFASAAAAILAAAQGQRALDDEPFPEPVHVRMGLHTGEATLVDGRYVGVAVHRAARICAAAGGGQVLVSRTTREIVADALPAGLELDELGRRKLKGLEGLERLFALRGEPAAHEARSVDAPAATIDSSAIVPPVRVSDSDREQVGAILREQCVDGRLTLEEFSLRLDEVYASRTEAELAAALRELPVSGHPRRARKRRSWLLTLFGSEQRRGQWAVPDRMTSFSLLGSPDLDFRHAVVTSDEVRITSIALMGSLTAIVPSGVEVDLGGFCLIGGNDFVTRDALPAAPLGPRLKIRCFSLIGGAAIKHVRAGEEPGKPALPPAGSV